jgi:bacillithiol biosynthesis cysteine-adding enzyme BshC
VTRPGPTFLARDYVRNEPHVGRFYEGHYLNPADYLEKARRVDGRFHRDARMGALSMLRGWTPKAQDRVDRFADEDGFFVTTGQQPGLFGGPLYSLYKALTAIQLSRALECLLERPVLALFWIASEDHDWAEADHTHILDLDNQLRTLRLPVQGGAPNRPLHRIRLEAGLKEALDELRKALPETDFGPPLLELLSHAYRDGTTLSRGFGDLFSELLRDQPIAFVDAVNDELKAASLPTLFRELERSEEHEALLTRASSHLEMEGYHAQVPILEAGVNLFFEGPEGRDRLYRAGEGVRLNRAGVTMSRETVQDASREDPTLLSPNVLLRPVLESRIFPTLSYVAGPGEMAYFGQLKELFHAHDLEMPVVYPRHSATLVEKKIGKVLGKFHRSVESMDRPFHEIAGEIALDEVPPDVRGALGKLRGAVGEGAGALAKAVHSIDPTLKGPVTHARNTAFTAFDEAERKILQALKRENEIALEQLSKAQTHLFPQGKLQERALNPFYYLVRYGPELLPALLEEFKVDLDDHSA